MKSRKEKFKRRILDALKDKAELSNNRGDFVRTKFKLSKKDRKRSGWRNPFISSGKMKYSKIFEQGLEPSPYWDNWFDYRDGWRHQSINDGTRLKNCPIYYSFVEEVIEFNKKIKKQIAIRKAKKLKKIEQSPLYSLKKELL